MANFQEEYMKWLLDGANPKTMPPSAFPVPPGAGGAPPVDMPPIPYQAKQVPPAGMPPIPPEAYGPQNATRGISPWQMLKSVPFAAGELAPAVAKYAGGAAAAHLAFPPEAGTPDEDKIAQLLFANPPTQSVKPSPLDEIRGMLTQKDLPQSGLEPAVKAAPAPAPVPTVKNPSAKAPMKDEDSPDARLNKRLQEREDAKAGMPKSREPAPGSLMELRMKAREKIRQGIKDSGNY